MDFDILLKLSVSLLLGGAIGLEREFHEKPAGLRTNIIICIGATIFTIVSLLVGKKYGQDPGRISAQIVTGVGFLGAGAIMREGSKISGLTTAAGIWLISAIGMAVGYGYYPLAFGATALVLLAQISLVELERFFRKFARFQTINARCGADWPSVQRVYDRVTGADVRIITRRVRKTNSIFTVELMVFGSSANIEEALTRLMDMQEVIDVDY
ncbi:MAG: MgtC/SapB family protein [Elusimicrobiales bacterium]|nr:MgtC/SapB family protein [Elusimicrobiales bacterium]